MRDGDVDLEALKAAVGPEHRRHHAHQPLDARGVRAAHRGGGAHRARGRRPALLRRRQPQRDPRQGAPGRHGLRCHPHEPAQDLLHAARRRRPGRRRGRRERAPAAVPADSDGGQRGRALPLARREATCRSPSAGCRRSWAMPACCCAPTSTCACSGREGMQPRGRVRHAECQLPAGAAAGRPASMPPTRSAARATSSSSRSSARRAS